MLQKVRIGVGMAHKLNAKANSAANLTEIQRNHLIIQRLIFFCVMLGTAYFVVGVASGFQLD